MVRALIAPLVWLLGLMLLVVQRAGAAFGAFLDGYDRGARAVGRALLRWGRGLLDWLGPLGRFLRRLTAPVWRRVAAAWQWLNVQVLMRMYRPLRRWTRWVVQHAGPLLTRLVRWLRQQVDRLEPLLVRLTLGVEAVERAAARLAAGWRRLWSPVLARAARWRRRAGSAEGS